jgi:hypothetical protein
MEKRAGESWGEKGRREAIGRQKDRRKDERREKEGCWVKKGGERNRKSQVGRRKVAERERMLGKRKGKGGEHFLSGN